MIHESTTFLAFIVLSVTFHGAGHWVAKLRARFFHAPVVEHHHAVALGSVAAFFAQPHFWQGVQEYVVVYSGHVLH